MKDIKNVIGDRIYALLAKGNVKQKELAKYLGVTDNTVSYFVNGTRIPNIETLDKIIKFFDVSADYLLGYNSAANKENAYFGEKLGLDDEAIEEIKKINEREDGYLMEYLNSILSYDLVGLLTHIHNYVVERGTVSRRQNEFDLCYMRKHIPIVEYVTKGLNALSDDQKDEMQQLYNKYVELCGDKLDPDYRMYQLKNFIEKMILTEYKCNYCYSHKCFDATREEQVEINNIFNMIAENKEGEVNGNDPKEG